MTLMLLHRTLTVKVLIWVFTMAGALLAKAESEAPMVDEIVLKNGSRLIGSITTIRDGVLTLETKFAGTLSVDMPVLPRPWAPAAQDAPLTPVRLIVTANL